MKWSRLDFPLENKWDIHSNLDFIMEGDCYTLKIQTQWTSEYRTILVFVSRSVVVRLSNAIPKTGQIRGFSNG